MKVHSIITCLNPAMVESSLLVFKTIRVGFPTFEIVVYSNNLPQSVYERLVKMGISPLIIRQTISHDNFLEGLINSESEPFWLTDSDVVYFDSMEGFSAPMFGGRFEPDFMEEWSDSLHVARLHPSVFYINPVAVRCAIREWRGRHIPGYFPNAITSLIRQQFIPSNGKTLFFDTCAGLHQAFKGTAFTPEWNSRFEHLFCGTYADTVSKETESLKGLFALHQRVSENPEVAQNIQHEQAKYYESRNGVTHAN